MTALTAPAPQATHRRPVPWTKLAWVTWRQHRATLAGVLVLLGGLSVLLVLTGLRIRGAYSSLGLGSCAGGSARCQSLRGIFAKEYFFTANSMPRYLQFAPALIGAFAGGPLLAREFETGTFRFAWTQGAGRTRWIVTKLILLAAVTTAAALAFSLLFSWWYRPFEPVISRMLAGQAYEVEGIVFAARTLFGVMLGALAGAERTALTSARRAALTSRAAIGRRQASPPDQRQEDDGAAERCPRGDYPAAACQGGGMRKYVIMGVQGSGKGTQATMLGEDFDLEHISVGDIFRWNVQHHTKLGAQVRRIMAAGELVGDDLVEGVVKAKLAEHDWNFGFIIDGFPRNERQAEFFLESYDIDGVIHLDMPDSEVRRRVLARRLCSGCGMDYNLLASSPRVAGQCDVCGGELIPREDDTEEALAVRLRDYHQKTNPVLDIFRRKEYVVTVDARPDREIVQQAIRAKLGLLPREPPMPVPAAGGQADGQQGAAGQPGSGGQPGG
jgi:adenylate kinase